MEIADNGRGFDPSRRPDGDGLNNIERRVHEARATSRWETAPGGGCKTDRHDSDPVNTEKKNGKMENDSSTPISVGVVEDQLPHPAKRKSLRADRRQRGLPLHRQCAGVRLRRPCRRNSEASPPQVVLLDIGLPGMSGIEGIPRLRRKWPSAALVVLSTVYEDNEAGLRGLRLRRQRVFAEDHYSCQVARGHAGCGARRCSPCRPGSRVKWSTTCSGASVRPKNRIAILRIMRSAY